MAVIAYFFAFMFFILCLLGFLWLIVFIMNKLLGVEVQKISNTPGKKVDRVGRIILLVIFLAMLPFIQHYINMKWYFIIFITLIFLFHAIMEWIYLKSSKQYISTFVFLIVLFLILINIDYIFTYFFSP
jgi:hypothetical protein